MKEHANMTEPVDKKKLVYGVVIGLAILAVAFLIYIFAFSADNDKVVRFGSGGKAVDYAPYLVAKNKKWFTEAFAKRGYEVQHTVFDSAPTINEAYETDRVDIVFVAEPPVIIGRAAGIDIRIVGISCSLIQGILVPIDSDIASVSDLMGKTIAVLKGSSSHYGVYKIIRLAKLQPSDIEVIDMLPPDARNAFETGRVDAWAVWPPWVEQIEVAGKGRLLLGGDVKIHSIITARGQVVQHNPELVEETLAVIQRAKQWMLDHPSEAKRILADELGVSAEVVDKSWPRHNFDAQITDEVIDDIQAKVRFLLDNDIISNNIDVRGEFVVNSP